MAGVLSGSYGENVSSHWRLQYDWSATQDVSENKSSVTVKLYWIARNGYGAINSGASKTAGIAVTGSSWKTVTKSGLASLSGNQKKLIHDEKYTITHDSDGGKSFTIDAYFDAEVTLNGSYFGRINLDAKTYELKTIPRESSLSNSPSWTAGGDVSLSIKRYASNFNHTADIYIETSSGTSAPDGRKYTHLKEIVFSTSQTSKSTSFSTAEKYEAFQRLAGGSSKRTWVRLRTYSGSKLIGTNDYYGTVKAPNASKPTVSAFTLGNEVKISISRSDSEFKHEVKASIGSWSKVLDTDATTSYTWNTNTDMNAILGQLGSKATGTVKITLTTHYYNGTSKQIVQSSNAVDVKVTVPNTQAPTFTGAVTWTDSNGTLNTLKGTGNNAIMIQGKSSLVVTLPSSALATAKAGTTMKNYTVTVNGKTKTKTHPTTATNLTFEFEPSDLNVSKNQTMKITAYDNRGLSTAVNKTITVVPYTQPSATLTAKRNDGFSDISTVGVQGSISPLNINGSNKNSVTSVKYRVKLKGSADTTYTTPVTMTLGTATLPSYRTNDITNLSLDSTKAWTVQFQVTDKIGTHSYTKDIQSGIPIIAWDANGGVGIGKYPDGKASLDFGKDKYRQVSEDPKKNSEGGAIDLNNSDITNANGIYFSDTANNTGEGLIFPRSDFPTDGTDTKEDNWDIWYVRDNVVYLNEKPMFYGENQILYSNAVGLYMSEGHTVTPTIPIENCPNGWVLVWGYIDQRNNWRYYHVPKAHVQFHNGGGIKIPLGGGKQGEATYKYVYVSKTNIKGAETNISTDNAKLITLKHVVAY